MARAEEAEPEVVPETSSQLQGPGRTYGPASDQAASPFFTRLPYEIRQQIYLECWRASGLPSSCSDGRLRQHIVMREDGHFTHTPCITNPHDRDARYAGFRNAPLASLERATWLQRLKTEWCLHWACEEAMLDKTVTPGPHPRPSTILPVLLTCKQTYYESLPTLYRSLTFLFTDLTAAEIFLFTFPRPHLPLRNLELSIRLSNLLTELYFPYAELAYHHHLPPTRLSSTNNPWSRVCDRLLALSHASPLSHLHIWLDTRDLRPWHKRVSETRMFGALRGLPELPPGDSDGGGPPVQQIIGRGLGREHFLREGEGEGEGEGAAPFVVVRGTRANNWSVHMGERVFGGGRI
ncbi:hypothetical protein B0T18DRAFT_443528 [Schizothecium vesticola]|uniref:DUF7730 domain-containing protein n=1 Tax=Schizothecium vesticola TaxID=314040 RepID=A0AA40F4T0_9PEZI|nr:hypothetical protein B0T18DRAFT_443528 [Schizothecium vesticola]